MSGLIALLDDVAAIAKVAAASVDDVIGQAAKASAKAAGAVIDSLQNIQKNPQKAPEALKGVLDAVKSILPGR